jgi:iron complex transport system ATP-binding protein
MKSSALLEMKNVRVKRGENQVFSNLTMTLPSDRSSAVIGPNGSGKSTLLKLINRELYPIPDSDSELKILGQPLWHVDELRQRMGVVSHEHQSRFFADATVLQVVVSGFYSSVTTWAHQTYSLKQLVSAHAQMESMDINHLSNREIGTLSTGQQRRALFAKALVNDPEFLILDEPTTALDIEATHKYLNIMEGLMDQGKKLVLVTHHLDEVPPQVDWIVLLKQGQVFAEGKREEIITPETLSALFELPLMLEERNGYTRALPLD